MNGAPSAKVLASSLDALMDVFADDDRNDVLVKLQLCRRMREGCERLQGLLESSSCAEESLQDSAGGVLQNAMQFFDYKSQVRM